MGALLAIAFNFYSESFIDFIIPITAGGFIYIASSDLIPELKKECSMRKTLGQLGGIFLGLGFMILIKLLFHFD